MFWLSSLSDAEKREMYDDACAAYAKRDINEKEFRGHLAHLGYNATDIDDEVVRWRKERLKYL